MDITLQFDSVAAEETASSKSEVTKIHFFGVKIMAQLTISTAITATVNGRRMHHNNATINKETQGATAKFDQWRLEMARYLDVEDRDTDAEPSEKMTDWEERLQQKVVGLSEKRMGRAIKVREANDDSDPKKAEKLRLEKSVCLIRRIADFGLLKSVRTKSTGTKKHDPDADLLITLFADEG